MASRSCSGVRPPHRAVRVPDDAVVERAARGRARRCCGRGAGRAGRAPCRAVDAAAWSKRPVQRGPRVGRGADRAAVPAGERLDRRGGVHVGHRHDVGRRRPPRPARPSTSSTWPIAAMSAIEQPAARSGRITVCCVGGEDVGRLGHEVHAAEDDVRRVRPGRRLLGQLEGVAGDVGELDDLVALVVVAEHEDPVAERRLGRAGARDEAGVGGGGQVAGALDAALAGEVAARAEHQQRQRGVQGAARGQVRGGAHTSIVPHDLPASPQTCRSCRTPERKPAGSAPRLSRSRRRPCHDGPPHGEGASVDAVRGQ